MEFGARDIDEMMFHRHAGQHSCRLRLLLPVTQGPARAFDDFQSPDEPLPVAGFKPCAGIAAGEFGMEIAGEGAPFFAHVRRDRRYSGETVLQRSEIEPGATSDDGQKPLLPGG